MKRTGGTSSSRSVVFACTRRLLLTCPTIQEITVFRIPEVCWDFVLRGLEYANLHMCRTDRAGLLYLLYVLFILGLTVGPRESAVCPSKVLLGRGPELPRALPAPH